MAEFEFTDEFLPTYDVSDAQYPAADLALLPLAALVVISAALTALGLGALRRRDIG